MSRAQTNMVVLLPGAAMLMTVTLFSLVWMLQWAARAYVCAILM